MRKSICHPSKHLCLLFFFVSVHFISAHAQGFSLASQNKLQQAIEKFQNDPNHPFVGGISAAIKVDGLAFWQGTTGYAARNVDAQNNLLPGGTAFTTATLSRIYSVTKTFTAALVLELAEEGTLGLDNKVSMYLPLNLINSSLNSSVTIRQLLAHESGYSDYTDEINLQIAVAFQPTHVWTPFEMLTFVHQISQPGAERRYSSTNYIILGAIIEAATGKPAEQLYRERFFEPLGLSSMYLDVRETQKPGTTLAAPHDNISPFNPIFQFTGQPTFPDAYTNISAFPFTAIGSLEFTGGGIISNAADLAEWGNALFGGRATSKTILDMMLNSISSTPDEFGNRLGYGIKNTPFISGSFDFIGHNGSAPGYRSAMFYNAERKMTIVVLTNFAGVSPYDIAKSLYEALPEFICGNKNKKEDKIQLCFNGNILCVDRSAAPGFIKKGAYLGNCEQSSLTKTTLGQSQIERPELISAKAAMTLFPNPSSNNVSILFQPTKSGKVLLDLYDMNGKLVSTIFNGEVEKGMQQKIEIETTNFPAGMYLIHLQTADCTSRQKLIISH
jgi:D-alanyl-D-alanine carboxypeptidase